MISMQQQAGLSEAEVLRFHDDGFLVFDEVFSSEEVGTLRDACASPHLVEELEKAGIGHQTVHMLGLTAKHPAFLELARSP